MATNDYDAIVIGTGSAGDPIARALAGSGQRVAIFESGHPGGSCVNFGCTPTKAMIRAAQAFHEAKNAVELGVIGSDPTLDLEKVSQRTVGIVEEFREGVRAGLEATENLDLIEAHARFAGEKEIEADGQRYTADTIIIATGTSPREPEVEGLTPDICLSERDLTRMSECPGRLAILGGGYLGVEFGQMFRRFGAEVCIVEHSDRLAKHEDPGVSQCLHKVLEDDGVALHMGCKLEKATTDGGMSTLHLSNGEKVLADRVVCAVGRVPNTADLNLEGAGIETTDRGHIKTDARLLTSVSGVYAAGDVNGGPAFTHVAYDDHRILRSQLLEDGSRTTSDRLSPYVLFSDPQLGRIGLTAAQASEQRISHRVFEQTMDQNGRAIEMGKTKGLIRVVVDAKSERILGAACFCDQGGEIMAIFQAAMMGGVTRGQLRDAIWAHPTYAELLNTLLRDSSAVD